MRESNKRYYDYSKRDTHKEYDREYNPRIKPHTILPAPSILEAYEDISEGSVDRLLDMAELEQIHRHEWENRSLDLYAKAHRFGQLAGLIVALLIIAVTFYVAKSLHDMRLAGIIAGSGFMSLMVSSVFASRIRRYDRRPRKFFNRKKTMRYDEAEE